jgi:predicted naringenin-chalcone synthase
MHTAVCDQVAALIQPRVVGHRSFGACRARLHSFRMVRPPHSGTQEQALSWLAEAHLRAEETRRLNEGLSPVDPTFAAVMPKLLRRYGCSPDKIAARGCELNDHLHTNWEAMEVYRLMDSPKGVGTSLRSQSFARGARRVLNAMYKDEPSAPDDLIHVTCTGYTSPSAAQILVGEKGWQQRTRVTHAYHMGCYAGLPAIRIASGFLSSATDPAHRVDIAHTEFCTLHLDPSDHSPEQLVVQSLFGDGHMRYSLSRVADATGAAMPDNGSHDGASGLRILALAEELVADSTDDMRWTITEWGFRMTLTQEVPQKIGATLPAFLAQLFAQADLDYKAEKDFAIFAIHPGGPKIIDQVSGALGLRPEQSAASRAVLRDYGNMSSATLPHVWDEILKSRATQPGQLVASVAFGPGLTISGGLFQIEK